MKLHQIKVFLVFMFYIVTISHGSSIKTVMRMQIPKEGCVILYSDCNYEGQKLEVCDDINDFRIISFKDQLRSLSLGNNVKVLLFQEKYFKGEYYLVDSDQPCFQHGYGLLTFTANTNSLKFIKNHISRPNQGCIRIFEYCNYQGKNYEFCADRPYFPKSYYNSNLVSSIWVGDNTEVQLFQEKKMEGKSNTFKHDNECFEQSNRLLHFNKAKSASVFNIVKKQNKEEINLLADINEGDKNSNNNSKSNKDDIPKNNIFIKSASWGDKDVTEILRKKTKDQKFGYIIAENSYFEEPLKILTIEYEINGSSYNKVVKEHDVLDLNQIEDQNKDEQLKMRFVQLRKKQGDINTINTINTMNNQLKSSSSYSNEQHKLINNSLNNNKIPNDFVNLPDKYFKSKKGTLILNNSKIVLTHLNTKSKLYTSSNLVNLNNGFDVSGSIENEHVHWWISSKNNYINNLDEVKIKHVESKGFLFSQKSHISLSIGQQEVIAKINTKDIDNFIWKIEIIKSYIEGDKHQLKVGDIIRIQHKNSESYLSCHNTKDFFSGNNEVYVQEQQMKSPFESNKGDDNISSNNNIFVITDFKIK